LESQARARATGPGRDWSEAEPSGQDSFPLPLSLPDLHDGIAKQLDSLHPPLARLRPLAIPPPLPRRLGAPLSRPEQRAASLIMCRLP
jgi:hypothetical protein